MPLSIMNRLWPANHKTIFVLDHTPYFGISCESFIEFDFLKSRAPGCIPITPITKSLWTCSVESAIEYCRIIWDIFPQGKLVRFIASDTVAHILNTWSTTQQNLSHIMNAMALIGIPPPPLRNVNNLDYTVLHGLRAALEAANEYTELQAEKKKRQLSGNESSVLLNRCRVICITSARDNDSMKRLEDIFFNVLQQQNKASEKSDRLIPIDHCHLVIINTFPTNVDSQVSNHPPKTLSPILTTEVHSIRAPFISTKLSALILDHYDLASTTVTGIPMKEEQNASSSANYDVEIFHSSEAHSALIKNEMNATVKTIKDGLEYETVTLKWCTPRGCTGNELQNCTSMHRITPVDVNSRPSLCLINFLLNGRSVMLEMPRKSGGKTTSHLLAAHGGEIFIHTLGTTRSVLEDPPSISEGCGGRVTDYRITDFGTLIKQNMLVPIKGPFTNGDLPIQKMRGRLKRHTKYWPLTISSTLIFNLKGLMDPLPTIITKEKITEEEVFQCKNIIYNLISLESKKEHLFPANSGQRAKGQKREDQYKMMWNELETLLKNNLHSPNHGSIYSCLLECHKFYFEDENSKLSDKVELDDALRELDEMGTQKSADSARSSVIRATTDSPMSPPPLASISSGSKNPHNRNHSTAVYATTPRTLLQIFENREKAKSRPDFVGRVNGTKLYPKLTTNDEGPRNETIVE